MGIGGIVMQSFQKEDGNALIALGCLIMLIPVLIFFVVMLVGFIWSSMA